MTIKTGCSAAIVALDSACKALASGDCESAIVGGTNLILSPALSCVLGAHGVNSGDGRCRSFDANASGYGRAEAVSSIVVKKLDDALRDGNPIRGVIRSTVCNDDGKTAGITQPNTEAHEALMRAAYAAAGFSEDEYCQTAFFECHGTGTPVGDPIEASAVARVFGKEGMIIGSVRALTLCRQLTMELIGKGKIQHWSLGVCKCEFGDHQSSPSSGAFDHSTQRQL